MTTKQIKTMLTRLRNAGHTIEEILEECGYYGITYQELIPIAIKIDNQ